MQRLLEESRKEIMAQKIIAADGSVYVKKKPFYLRWWFITLVILVLLGGCASIMGGGSASLRVLLRLRQLLIRRHLALLPLR